MSPRAKPIKVKRALVLPDLAFDLFAPVFAVLEPSDQPVIGENASESLRIPEYKFDNGELPVIAGFEGPGDDALAVAVDVSGGEQRAFGVRICACPEQRHDSQKPFIPVPDVYVSLSVEGGSEQVLGVDWTKTLRSRLTTELWMRRGFVSRIRYFIPIRGE